MLQKIKELVEIETKIRDISKKSRLPNIVDARVMYYYLAKKYTGLSYHRIAKKVNRDHATVINGLRKWDEEIIYDPYMEIVYNKIKSILSDESIVISSEENAELFQLLEARIYKLEELCYVV